MLLLASRMRLAGLEDRLAAVEDNVWRSR